MHIKMPDKPRGCSHIQILQFITCNSLSFNMHNDFLCFILCLHKKLIHVVLGPCEFDELSLDLRHRENKNERTVSIWPRTCPHILSVIGQRSLIGEDWGHLMNYFLCHGILIPVIVCSELSYVILNNAENNGLQIGATVPALEDFPQAGPFRYTLRDVFEGSYSSHQNYALCS